MSTHRITNCIEHITVNLILINSRAVRKAGNEGFVWCPSIRHPRLLDYIPITSRLHQHVFIALSASHMHIGSMGCPGPEPVAAEVGIFNPPSSLDEGETGPFLHGQNPVIPSGVGD